MFTVEEAAAYFVYLGATGVTHWTVRGLIKSGQLIYEPIGRRFYVSRSSIDDYISKRERRAKP
jgi:excisionase family DNA binding protein